MVLYCPSRLRGRGWFKEEGVSLSNRDLNSAEVCFGNYVGVIMEFGPQRVYKAKVEQKICRVWADLSLKKQMEVNRRLFIFKETCNVE